MPRMRPTRPVTLVLRLSAVPTSGIRIPPSVDLVALEEAGGSMVRTSHFNAYVADTIEYDILTSTSAVTSGDIAPITLVRQALQRLLEIINGIE